MKGRFFYQADRKNCILSKSSDESHHFLISHDSLRRVYNRMINIFRKFTIQELCNRTPGMVIISVQRDQIMKNWGSKYAQDLGKSVCLIRNFLSLHVLMCGELEQNGCLYNFVRKQKKKNLGRTYFFISYFTCFIRVNNASINSTMLTTKLSRLMMMKGVSIEKTAMMKAKAILMQIANRNRIV